MAEKRHINIGTIGHVDHGKTSLTAAILKVLSKQYSDIKILGYSDIDKSPEEKARGITINQTTVNYHTEKTDFAHTDCPGHADYVKNMITGASQMDVAILVVAATDGPMPQTREHVLLAKQVGVKRIVVFVNKCDIAESDMIELVIDDIKEILKKQNFIRDEDGFRDQDLIIACGSARKALDGDPAAEEVIINFFKEIDEKVSDPERDMDKPFLLPIGDVFSITGRGTVVAGVIEAGTVKLNDEMEIVGGKENKRTVVTGVEAFHTKQEAAYAGQNVGILLRGVGADEVARGNILCRPGTVKKYVAIQAEMYILSKEEGGRHTPIISHYRPQVFIRTGDYTGEIFLVDKEMVMPGENVNVKIKFANETPVDVGVRFAVREGGKTIGSGIITQVFSDYVSAGVDIVDNKRG